MNMWYGLKWSKRGFIGWLLLIRCWTFEYWLRKTTMQSVTDVIHWLAFVNTMLNLWILVKKDYHAVSYRRQVYSCLGHVLLVCNYVCTQHTSCGACEGIRMCRDANSIHILVVFWQINAYCTFRPSLHLRKALGYNSVRGWLCPLWP